MVHDARAAANLRCRLWIFNAHFSFGIIKHTGLPRHINLVRAGQSEKTKAAEEFINIIAMCPEGVTVTLDDTYQNFVISFETIVVKINQLKVTEVVCKTNNPLARKNVAIVKKMCEMYKKTTPLHQFVMQIFDTL